MTKETKELKGAVSSAKEKGTISASTDKSLNELYVRAAKLGQKYPGIPAQGSKRTSVSLLNRLISKSSELQECTKAVDLFAGGASFTINCGQNFEAVHVNEYEPGLSNLQKVLHSKGLPDLLLKVNELFPKIVNAFRTSGRYEYPGPSGKEANNEADRAAFKFIARDYTLGEGIIELDAITPSDTFKGYKDVVADELTSAALTFVAVITSSNNARVSYDWASRPFSKFLEDMDTACAWIEQGTFYENLADESVKKGRPHERLRNIHGVEVGLHGQNLSFSHEDAMKLLDNLPEVLDGTPLDKVFFFVDPPYVNPTKKQYSVDTYNNSLKSWLQLLAKLLSLGVKFIICLDDTHVECFNFAKIFPHVRIYRTFIHRIDRTIPVIEGDEDEPDFTDVMGARHYECYITNVELSSEPLNDEDKEHVIEKHKALQTLMINSGYDFQDFPLSEEQLNSYRTIKEYHGLAVKDFFTVDEVKKICDEIGCSHLLDTADFSYLSKDQI